MVASKQAGLELVEYLRVGHAGRPQELDASEVGFVHAQPIS